MLSGDARVSGLPTLPGVAEDGRVRRGFVVRERRGVWAPSLRAAKKCGRVLTCGATAGHDPQTDLRYLWVRELDVLGSNSYSQEDVARSVDYVADGKLSPVVSRTFPLEKLGKAEQLMEDRGFFGKIVLTP